jgi:16S rRNA processing protein RimM
MSKYKRLYQSSFIQVGIIRRSHGYKGHAKISIEDSFLDDFKQQKFVFIEIDGYKVPFRIEDLSVERDMTIKLSGCDNSEDMSRFQLHALYLLSDEVKVNEQKPLSQPNKLVNMTIVDNRDGAVGSIVRVDDYPQQKMAIILDENQKEILIPLHESLIERISIEEQIIYMNLPEGLI